MSGPNKRISSLYYYPVAALCIALCLIVIGCGKTSSPKFKQYYAHGEKLYLQHCSNCHQKNGTGLGRVYPPLNKSDYMQNNLEDVLCLMRYGKDGQLIVNGREYNQPMPGVQSLSDLEIAEIATYIYNTWEHKRGLIEVKAASGILERCTAPDQ